MYMSDWIAKLNEFLKLSERNILSHLGKVSHEKALNKAKKEYIEYQKLNIIPSPVEKHFLTSIKGKRLTNPSRQKTNYFSDKISSIINFSNPFSINL